MGTRLEIKSSRAPDEVRPFVDKGRVEVMHLGDHAVMRGTFEPGWQWSKHVKPLAGTPSCQTAHVGYCMSGRMRIVMDDGAAREFGPGDFFSIDPGHDAQVLGDEPCVLLDFGGVKDYAKQAGGERKVA